MRRTRRDQRAPRLCPYLLLTSSVYSAVFVPAVSLRRSVAVLYMRRGPGAGSVDLVRGRPSERVAERR